MNLKRRVARLESGDAPMAFDLGRFFADLLRKGESAGAPTFQSIPVRGTDDIARFFDDVLREAGRER